MTATDDDTHEEHTGRERRGRHEGYERHGQRDRRDRHSPYGDREDRAAYGASTRLVLETMPRESRIGLALGFVRTFGIPDIARVLHGTGRMTDEPRGRAKATGVARFTLIGHGLQSDEGRGTLKRLHQHINVRASHRS
ncbi:hypothetical protein [Streptomyces axinellae]|uniref:Uncharacterized protein n=1 Tax=Streptomyces axinellae TaxID=552788 RepID=A0ABN3Q0R3_9ACTN